MLVSFRIYMYSGVLFSIGLFSTVIDELLSEKRTLKKKPISQFRYYKI